jgi:hypothetical protein
VSLLIRLFADFGRLVPQMDLQRISDGRLIVGIELAKLLGRISGEDDLVPHRHASLAYPGLKIPLALRSDHLARPAPAAESLTWLDRSTGWI